MLWLTNTDCRSPTLPRASSSQRSQKSSICVAGRARARISSTTDQIPDCALAMGSSSDPGEESAVVLLSIMS
jgi:hypothetical protein